MKKVRSTTAIIIHGIPFFKSAWNNLRLDLQNKWIVVKKRKKLQFSIMKILFIQSKNGFAVLLRLSKIIDI